jgi:sensor c-di-GMP phosphodiesterase-like protein
VPANADDCALTEAMMMIADSLAMGVVVEGVETKAQFDFIARRLNGDIQGFLFSRPVPAAEFEHLLATDLFRQKIGETARQPGWQTGAACLENVNNPTGEGKPV